MLSNMLPNAICCATCFPTHDTVQHAAQITAQLAGQHNILPIMPPTQHAANCRQTIFPACDPTKYAAHHAAQQNMLSKHSMLHNMLHNVPPNFAAVGRYGEFLVFL
jgi:hypothetical protein